MSIDLTQKLSGRLPLLLRRGDRPQLPAAHVRVPLDPGAAQGGADEPVRIGAAFGILVAVFQWGWGADLIGVSKQPIVAFSPMMLFAILFGLSMDYEVFLLSRVKEEYDRTHDNGLAVADGLAATARVITAAAAIMVCVFVSFVFGPTPRAKLFGLGLAVAILIDATVVRMVLVPATMELLGDANWWLPRWLDRLLPRFAIEPRATPVDPIDPVEPVEPIDHGRSDRRPQA